MNWQLEGPHQYTGEICLATQGFRTQTQLSSSPFAGCVTRQLEPVTFVLPCDWLNDDPPPMSVSDFPEAVTIFPQVVKGTSQRSQNGDIILDYPHGPHVVTGALK